MFNRQDSPQHEPVVSGPVPAPKSTTGQRTVNRILKGSRMAGDVQVDCDMELSGEVEGNITSETDSNIVIKGVCKGGITTKEGSVSIQGELKGGDIVAGSDVTITGKFGGGKVSARGKIHVDGEFNGVLEAQEIEVGPSAKGAGRLLYRDSISIAKGAQIEGEIARIAVKEQVVVEQPKKAVATPASESAQRTIAGGRSDAQAQSTANAEKPSADKKVVTMQGAGREPSKPHSATQRS